MDKITDWTHVGLQSITALGQTIMTALPNILGAIFLILFGWLIARAIAFLVNRALTVIGFDKLSSKIHVDEILEKASIKIGASKIVSKFVYWVIFLLFFITASDTLGWTVVSASIGDLISYLPRLFSAIVIFIIGFYIATFVRKGLKSVLESLSVSTAPIISAFAFYIILIIITLTALDQAGVDTTLLTSNVTIILGGIILAFSISFGLGSRDVLTNILSSFYSRKNFAAGQKIEIDGVKGVIEKIDSTSCAIKTETGITVIPVKKLLSEKVDILF